MEATTFFYVKVIGKKGGGAEKPSKSMRNFNTLMLQL